jgi:hypothetical protein
MTRSPSLFDPADGGGERTLAFDRAVKPRKRKRRQPPLSIRLTPEERADLEARAGDLPVSAYAKSLLFAVTAKPARLSPRNPSLDHQILGQLLGALGRAEIAPHLCELVDAVRSGSLPFDEVTAEQLERCSSDIAWMRDRLMEALGVGGRR